MSEYLTKEEMLQWRRSTEKCTLEEYAAKLGKKLETEKETNDMVDIINRGDDVVQVYNLSQEDRGIKVYVRPKEEPVVVKQPKTVKSSEKHPIVNKTDEIKQADIAKETVEKITIVEPVTEKQVITEPMSQTDSDTNVNEKSKMTFSKQLTDREQKVLDYFMSNAGTVIFAKDLAVLLDLKRDYIYKYIKNLRAKIIEEVLVNSEEGGFIFKA